MPAVGGSGRSLSWMNSVEAGANQTPGLREKARMPRAVHGDEWPIQGFGAASPQSDEAFSLEEAPPGGRGSSL
jgi:hypothetical protein